MKIIRIGILNLNSLIGEQTIDFTASPLADHQLYAITGPTGAGKTTILDAITLALYGQTERNKSEKDRKDGSGSVMTYGTGECRAELEYATASGRYKNVWHRQRAHKKPDRDLTASRREISKWNPETEDWDILATKKREVDAKTEEVVGLDYERFVRSVMLTQGDFARFLKSDPGDKAAILEKITGTEVYKDLSIAAYTRAKLAREAWQRATEALSVAPPLEAEQRTSLEQQLADKTKEVTPLKTQLQQTNKELALHDNLQALRRKLQVAETEQSTLAEAWQAFTPDRDRLALSTALQPLAPDLSETLRLTQASEKLVAEAAQNEARLTEQEAAVTAAKAGVTQAQDKLNLFYEKLP
ncbi:MAG: AAA family ATPase, partial [Bacteroidota bacterium]